MLINKKLLEQLISLANDSAEYLNEKWITVKPHGDDSKGVHVKVEDGETSKQAVERKFGDNKTSKYKAQKIKKIGKNIEIQTRTTKGLGKVTGKRSNIDGIDLVIHKRDTDWNLDKYAITDFNTGLQLTTISKEEDAKNITFKKVMDKYKEEIKKHPVINID